MTQIHGLEPLLPTSLTTPPSQAGGSADASFLQLLGQQLESVNHQHQLADQQVKQLVLGQSDNVHDVVLNVAKADLMFRMVLEIRNRLMDSYQELMRMQI